MKRMLRLALAFALLVAAIESLKLLVAWWRADMPAPGFAEILAAAVLAVAAIAWWRHSVFVCRDNACLSPGKQTPQDPGKR